MPTDHELRLRAMALLRQMLLGRDPTSGVTLSQDHLLNRPEVMRALVLACESLEARPQGKCAVANPLRAGAGWTETEDEELRSLFMHGESTRSIAEVLERSAGAIRSRLVKLDLLDDFQATLDEAKEARKR